MAILGDDSLLDVLALDLLHHFLSLFLLIVVQYCFLELVLVHVLVSFPIVAARLGMHFYFLDQLLIDLFP